MKLSKKDKYILNLWIKRKGGGNLLESMSPTQHAFAVDTGIRIAALTGRQAGKTETIIRLMIDKILREDNVSITYTGLTKKSMKPIFLRMKRMNRDLGLGLHFVNNEMITENKINNSIITMFGIDDSSDEAEKIRGQTNDMVMMDECGHYRQNLEEIYSSIIQGTLKIKGGSCYMVGTPGNILGKRKNKRNDFFFRVTEGLENGWKVHKWTALDVPALREAELKYQEELLANNPNEWKKNSWKKEVEGKWIQDDSICVIHYSADINSCAVLPTQEYKYYVGIDFGWRDDTAIVLCGVGQKDNIFYILKTFSKNNMLLEDIERELKLICRNKHISGFFGDHAPLIIEELNRRLGISIQKADKVEKYDAIKIMDDDFMSECIKIYDDGDIRDNILAKQLEGLIWDENDTRSIMDGQDDHLFHALLYVWRSSYYIKKNKEITIITSEDAGDKWNEAQVVKIQEKMLKNKTKGWKAGLKFNNYPKQYR